MVSTFKKQSEALEACLDTQFTYAINYPNSKACFFVNATEKQFWDEYMVKGPRNNYEKIRVDKPCYLFLDIDKTDQYPNTDIDEIIYEKDNFFGITADFKAKKKMKKNFKKTILILNGYEKNKKKTFSYWEGQNEIDQELMIDKDISDNAKNIFQKLNNSKLLINFHNDEEQLDLGSALCVLVFLAKISKKINVYGYDHYLKSEIAEMNYIKLMYSIFSETSKINPKPVKQSFIKFIINYYFIEYYENLENININSYLKNLRRHKYLIKLINKVFINPY